MEGRTRLAAGGFIAGTASIAAVAAVVMTNSAALADVSGAPVHATAIVIPLTTAAEASEGEASPVDSSTVTIVATAPSAATEAGIVASAAATGSWDAAYEWSKNHGWTSIQTDEWIVRLDAKLQQYAQSHDVRATETSGLGLDGLMSGSQKDRSPDSPNHSD